MTNGDTVSAEFIWKVPPSRMAQEVREYRDRLIGAVSEALSDFAVKVEAWAKAHAPWTDRTANARQGLSGRSQRNGSKIAMILGHKMFYGIYLELSNNGKWGIVQRSLQEFYPRIMAVIRGLVQ